MMMNTQSIGNHIQHFFTYNGKISLFLEQQAVDLWAETVGEFIANHTTKIYAKQGVIYVSIPNAALRFEILNSRSQIIAKLNKQVGGDIIKGIIVT
jgi:predicted nucleic acid-binding Zn ribbon protein